MMPGRSIGSVSRTRTPADSEQKVQDERPSASDLLREAVGRVGAADPADTGAVLRAAWQGFCSAGAAGELLALYADPVEYPPLRDNARHVLKAAADALRAAPSLPVGLPTEAPLAALPHGRLDDTAAAEIRRLILDLALALNIALHAASGHAVGRADRTACRDATALSSKLSDCYEGRLVTFLRPPPSGSKDRRRHG
jgi:hypothetical protein